MRNILCIRDGFILLYGKFFYSFDNIINSNQYYILITDRIRRDGVCVEFKAHRRRRIEREHNRDKHGNVRCKNDNPNRYSEIHVRSKTNERLSKSHTSQVTSILVKTYLFFFFIK